MSSRRPKNSGSSNKNSRLEEDFAAFAGRLNTLGNDCRLSFLEIKLYRKYFVDTSPKSNEKLNRLKLIVDTLEKHRKNTINVLKTIHEREAIMDAIHGQIERISSSANRNASILDFQSDGLHLIYLHQQVTLRVVEAVENWRRPLTRPFPFIHQGENYFAKILADTAEISTSSLGKILPVKLNQYPLCSDLPSLCLFATPNPAASMSKGSKQPTSRMTSEMTQKINSAQAILLEEIDTQKRLLRELEGLSTAGFFLPVLNLHSIIPSCSTGIRMSNHEWEEQLREAIAEAKDDLDTAEDRAHNPTTTSASQSAGAAHHHHINNKNSNSTSNNNRNHPGGAHNSNKYQDDDDASTSPSTSSSSSSSGATTPERSTNPAPPAPPQRRVSIDESSKPARPSSASSSSHQPQPPPRPTSAKKRTENTNLPPTAPPQQKKENDDEDGFEKDSSSSSSSSSSDSDEE